MGFLNLDITDICGYVSLFSEWGYCLAHCKMVKSIPGLSLPDASSTSLPTCDNQKYFQSLLNVSWEAKPQAACSFALHGMVAQTPILPCLVTLPF